MSENEKQKIIESAKFLEYKGYTKSVGAGTITYSNDGINIIIAFESNSDVSDISIRFEKENEIYSVGWIACVRSGLNIDPHKRLENVLMLLSYIRENYSTIIEIDYCEECNKFIDEFIAKRTKKNM